MNRNRNVMLAMTGQGDVFIGDLKESEQEFQNVYKTIHQVTEGGKKLSFGMVDPFLPYSDHQKNEAVPRMAIRAFVAFRKPSQELEDAYVQLVSGIVNPTAGPGGGKVVSAQAGEVIRFSDRKPRG